jgi:starch synthase
VPLYLNTIERERFGDAASVMTIHNLAHQGYGPMSQLAVAQVPSSEIKADGLEHFGLVNLFKGGLYHASKITTVSPTYAWEIRTPEGGHGLDHVLRFRGADVLGILNGIDTDVWNPATDPHLPAHFDVDDLSGKDVCKAALQREMGLDVDPSRPIFGVVSRLHEQKGIDIICGAAQGLVERGAQLVVLGTGDPDLEGWLRHLDWIHRPVAVRLRFDEGLAHRIEAGSDFFLMPSRFEPCGLNQMYSQRYGTLPVVREVGGLVDSVDQYDPATARGTGFRFFDLDVPALLGTCQWALDTWWHRPDHIHALRQQGMRKEWGWDVAAAEYENVYRWAREARGVV